MKTPHEDIPPSLLLEIHDLINLQGKTVNEAVSIVRQRLVPVGFEAWPYRRRTPESLVDKLRSLIGTHIYRGMIAYWKVRGVDFSTHLYVPEKDPITENPHHERADHNHILKRIGKHTREGKYLKINVEAFDEAMLDRKTGLTHTALTGQRKQSVSDAERLLSHHVAKFFKKKGYEKEAEYVSIIADWHEASDGRGMSQLQRSKANYRMLNYILDEWMPWHRTNYNFSLIDINK